MNDRSDFQYSTTVLLAPLVGVLLIWTVFYLEVSQGWNLNELGVYPRRLNGLKGIVFAPFIHSGAEHLYNNTIPLAVLLGALFYFYRPQAWRVLLIGLLFAGLFTWLVGRPSYHIGASGAIYLLASFIFFKGIRSKHYRLVALSLLVVFLYGGLLWYVFPVAGDISWEGHLGGFLAGLGLAFLLPTHLRKPVKYAWEDPDYDEAQDPFLKHFDEAGNFMEYPDGEQPDDIEVRYHYRETDPKEGP